MALVQARLADFEGYKQKMVERWGSMEAVADGPSNDQRAAAALLGHPCGRSETAGNGLHVWLTYDRCEMTL